MRVLKPQEGPQTAFCMSQADIVIFGGQAGGGKSWILLVDPLRYTSHARFGAVIFRRTYPEIMNEGGLWDEALGIYPSLGAKSTENPPTCTFPNGSTISFAHMQHEKDKYSWQGSQIPYIGIDEVTHFSESQFWYIVSRNRNAHGIPSLLRATCNPDPDSFVRQLIDWWIDEDGYAIPERSGVLRYFLRIDNILQWSSNKRELENQYTHDAFDEYGNSQIKSFTFIHSKLSDNKILMQNDPGYRANLRNLPYVERMRLEQGNWNVRPAPGLYFKSHYFEIVDEVPHLTKIARGWDLAASEVDQKSGNEPAATVGVKIGTDGKGTHYIIDMKYERYSPNKVEQMIKNTATQDGRNCIIRLPQDPGQAGKSQIAYYSKILDGYNMKARTMSGDKVTRAGPLSSAAEHGRIKIVKGAWNDKFIMHAEAFPTSATGKSPDVIDAAVEAFYEITDAGGTQSKVVAPISITL